MEIKAILNKPYTDKQRIDFIVSENHTKGYEIKETETALEAWGLTAEEIAEKEKEAHKKELYAQLDYIDSKSIRSIRAKEAGTATQDDLDKLEELELQAAQIRRELKELDESL